jgi:hypothetical protein
VEGWKGGRVEGWKGGKERREGGERKYRTTVLIYCVHDTEGEPGKPNDHVRFHHQGPD